ncbi:MAG TPA: oxidoreductase [Solirubrobacteraceae bacterium]|nr:oxidoreductase [Solirubrobacteraceae bacterium]
MAQRWTERDVPDQSGRLAVVTGANSGLGLATATGLARARAKVVLACRDEVKGAAAGGRICSAVPAADVHVARLDLGDLGSVRSFAENLGFDRVDLLINNAGVMAPPRTLTKDGFESQFGTNHLGHFALTGLLLPRLQAAPEPRVVTVSSTLHRRGKIDFDDLQGERRYNPWDAYGQSKLANLMFCFELQRRAVAAGSPLTSMAAHPGYAATNLQSAVPHPFYARVFMALGNRLLAQSAEMGALPTLYAATVPDLPGGSYIGPDGRGEQRGYPRIVTAAGKAYDEDSWRRLWEVSEALTGVHYSF